MDETKAELTKQYIEGKQLDDNAAKKYSDEKEIWEGERSDLFRKMKEMTRQIEEYEDEVAVTEEVNKQLRAANKDLEQQVNTHIEKYRSLLK